ncbi:MAG: mechanosensitive ion channel [Flavobacteriaceae bacterium]|nr:mechanosensitive ion channel [Mangrovimonas sp.]MCB0427258.1 mechanosensitive ion channel [Mangrovimonas sp.]MCB0435295.1 mechanosensitive ion channel [Mangrovimonas sp.]MCB0439388.1 mechanosensitive ion channel [Mangrovimonas sp.]HPF97031.1 mechanosensitive ion channel [Mangrovimonas sp.]
MFSDITVEEIIPSLVLLGICIVIWFLTVQLIRKVGKKSGINDARIKLIVRYFSVALILIASLVESFILGVDLDTLAVVFSSTFAVIGIAFFAIWSILSNITSGAIMFFSFPYKVGDKIKIHDKDFPIEAIIEDIRAFQLHLRLENGDLVTYPNNLILQKPVTLVEKDAIEDIHVQL